jgi:hypothetical protein
MQKRFALLATVSLLACGNNKVPLPTGLTMKVTTTETSSSTSFHKRGTSAPVEQSTSFSFADTCAAALQPATASKRSQTSTATDTWEVLGQTNLSHPLVPNSDTFSSAQASIIKATHTRSGERVDTTTVFAAGSAPASTTTTTSTIDIEGNAAYFAMAVDEYYVILNEMNGLWAEIDQHPDHNPEPPTAGGGGGQGISNSTGEAEALPVTMLTRYEPKKGDIWSSTNGVGLYFADGTEELTIGGKKFTTNRIKVYSVRPIDPTASDVLSNCVTELKSDTTVSPGGNSSQPVAFLNNACTGSFVHALVGTEWWYKGARVKASMTTINVQIPDTDGYGYEYTTADIPAPGQCSRFFSITRPLPPVTSEIYVQYTVTTTNTESIATELKEAAQ